MANVKLVYSMYNEWQCSLLYRNYNKHFVFLTTGKHPDSLFTLKS